MTEVLIRDLQPATRYRLQIRSKNAKGEVSQWSRVLDFNTGVDQTAPKPPTNLQAVVLPRGQFKATWDAPTEDAEGAPLFDLKDYIVHVFSPSSPQAFDFAVTSPEFTLTFEANLATFIAAMPDVGFTVSARDNFGNVSVGNPTAFATNQRPPDVSNFDAEGSVDSITFDWDPVVEVEDDISYYLIRQGLSAVTVVNSVYRGLAVPATWETIYEGLQYFSIVAVDMFGQESVGRATDTATARSSITVDVTPPGVPGAVNTTTGVDTTDPSAASVYIDVTWTPPADTDVQEYIIRYSPTIGNWTYLSVPAEDTTGAKTSSARIPGLTAGQSYYVAVQAVDFRANFSAFGNSQVYPQPTTADTTAPSMPAAPTIAANTMQIQVQHNLKKTDGTTNLERDVHHLEVYASTTTGFTPATANKIGDLSVIPIPASGTPVTSIESFPIPASAASGNSQTWFAKVIAVDNAGNKSAASAQSSASVPLVGSLNVQDAAITDAKIGSLSVSKVTAGTGTAFDWTINSQLTMGSASTNGVMQSYDYVGGGTTGWRIEKGAFIVNNGSINARALRLQDGQNLLHPAYTDFEWAPVWYTGKLGVVNSATTGIHATDWKYGVSPTAGQSLRMTWSGAGGTDRGVVLAPDLTSYNVAVDESVTYIFSIYVKNLTTSPGTIRLIAKNSPSAATTSIATDVAVPSSTAGWTRISGTFTPPAGTTRALFYLVSQNAAFDYIIDGVQLEQQRTGETLPSPWTPPSLTIVDGGDIRTGEIRSTASADGVAGQPAWSINTAGNFQLGSGNVRGTLYVGPTGTPEASSKIRSAVYTAGSGGWQVDGNGTAEFNQVTVRGAVYASSGNFTNEIVVGNTTTSAHYVRSFNYSSGVGGWVIRADGYAEFNNVTVRGTVIGGAIVGATYTTAYSGPRVNIAASSSSTSPAYGRIEFWPANGEWIPADLRCGEGAADRYIQVWSPSYGGERAHISVGGAGFGGVPEVVSVAPGGTIYMSGDTIRTVGSNTQIDTTSMAITANLYIRPGNTTSGVSGNIWWHSSNNIQKITSSVRYKTDIQPSPFDPMPLLTLEAKSWKGLPGSHEENTVMAGFIAEEVAEVYPIAKVLDDKGRVDNYNERALIAGMLQLIQRLYKRVDELEART